MKKFEYKIIETIEESFYKSTYSLDSNHFEPDKYNYEAYIPYVQDEKELNSLGKEGWELVTVVKLPINNHLFKVRYFLKRDYSN